MIATSQQGETVDEICWRALGRTAGVTEQVLEANAGLADLGPQLPGGVQITLPAAADLATEQRATVKLWD